jgi:hypothetical protein
MRTPNQTTTAPDEAVWIELVRRQVSSLQFGAVEIVVHDSRVVQIERTERVRLGQGENVKPSKASLASAAVGVVSRHLAS